MKFFILLILLIEGDNTLTIARKIAITGILFMMAFSASSQDIGWNEPLGLDTSVHRGVLTNGFTYYVVRNAKPVGKIEILLIERAGGYHGIKPTDQGVAHLVEHLSLRSSADFPQGQQKAFTNFGLTLGRDYNARTSESTDYMLTIPNNDTALLDLGLLAMKSWAKGRKYIPAEVEQERSAVLNEIRQADNAAFMSLLEARYHVFNENALYLPHVATEIKNIEEVSIERLRDFDNTWYQPSMQCVIIVGDINAAKIEKRLRELLSPLTNEEQPKRPYFNFKDYEVEVTGRIKTIVVSHGSENPTPDIRIFYKKKSSASIGGPNTLKEFKLSLIDRVLDRLIQNRFRLIALQSGSKAVQGAMSTLHRREIHPWAAVDAIVSHISPSKNDSIIGATSFLLKEMERIRRFGFSDDEFDESKLAVRSEIEKDTARSSAGIARTLEYNFIYGSGYRILAEKTSLSILDSLSANTINQSIKNDWILGDKIDVDIVLAVGDPGDPKIPTATEISSLIKETRNALISPFSDPRTNARLKQPSNEGEFTVTRAAKRRTTVTKLKEIDGTQVVLPNGIKVIIKRLGPHDKNRSPWAQVRLRAFKKGGTNLSYPAEYASATIAGDLIGTSGLGDLNRFELRRWLNQQNENGYLSVTPYITEFEEGVSGISSMSNYERMLMMTHLYFTRPKADQESLNTLLLTKGKLRSNGQILQDTINNEMSQGPFDFTSHYEGHPDLEIAFRIYNERFEKASDFTFVIVGYFEIEEMVNAAIKYLGSIPVTSSKKIKKGTRQQIQTPPYLNKHIAVSKTELNSADVHVIVPLQSKLNYRERTEMLVLNEMVKGYLFDRLRTKDGFAYRVNSTFTPISAGYYSFDINFVSSPSNTQFAIDASLDVLKEVSMRGGDDVRLKNAVETVLRNLSADVKSPSLWIDFIAAQTLTGQSFYSFDDILSHLKGLTRNELTSLSSSVVSIDYYSTFQQ